ncbi:MAG: fused MFS/spermidine synthase [Lachnospiraceae bacterium]|nr:fused MFS/spermidine synthase [Lachnospiraceae bacterium]
MAVIDTIETSQFNPHIEILEEDLEYGPARMLYVEDICQSAMWLDPALTGEPVLKYARRLRETVSREMKEAPPKEILVMGGAGLEVPRFLLRDLPDAHITVVEVDPVMEQVAQRYFGMEDLRRSGRLDLTIADASLYLEKLVNHGGRNRFDLIIEDAFCGIHAETALLTDKACIETRQLLTDKGAYVINLVSAITGSDSWPLLMERDILLRFFEAVRAYPATPDLEQEKVQNIIMAANGYAAQAM